MTLEEKKDYNVKLFPIYKMFAWDLLFYYAISFLFLTEVKNFTPADIVLVDVSVYTFFKFLSQLPSTIFVDKLGKKQSLVMANIFLVISILLIIFASNIYVFVFAEAFMAIAYAIKSLTESNILYDSLPHSEKRQKHFSALDGKGSSLYYYLNAVSCAATGFCYMISPYLPVVLCLCISILALYLSTRFYSLNSHSNIELSKVPTALERLKEYMKEYKYIFKHIVRSGRLRSLILFYGLFQSLIAVTNTLDRSLLTDLNVVPSYFGIIYAALAILSGVSSNLPNKIHARFRNRVLTVFSIFMVASCLLSGLLIVAGAPVSVIMIAVIFSFAIRAILKGPFYTLYKRYLNSFSTSSVRTKIYTATYTFENLLSAIIALAVSAFLDFASTAVCFTLLGLFAGVAFYFLLKYMKTRVGLKPEEYRKEDINLIDVK